MSDKGRQYRVVGGFYDGPAIGRLEGEAVIAIRNKMGDRRLQEACLALMARTAPDTLAWLLGTKAQPTPGTERIYQTSSAARLAA